MKKTNLIFLILFLIIIAQTVEAGRLWGDAYFGNVAGEHWSLINDPVDFPDDDESYVWTDYDAGGWLDPGLRDAYELEDPSEELTEEIGRMRITVRYQGRVNVGLRLYGNEEWPLSRADSDEWRTDDFLLLNPDRPGEGDWTWQDIKDLQLVLDLAQDNGTRGKVTQLFIEIYHDGPESPELLMIEGPGDYTNIDNPVPGGDGESSYDFISFENLGGQHWVLVDDLPGSPDDYESYIWNETFVEKKDCYQLQDPPEGIGGFINNLNVVVSSTGVVRAGIILQGNYYDSTGSVNFCGKSGEELLFLHESSFSIFIWPLIWSNVSWNDIKNMEVCVTGQADEVDCPGQITQAYVRVSHTDSGFPNPLELVPVGIGSINEFENPVPTGGVSYGVQYDDETGIMFGKAFSDTIGWISFDQEDLINCPEGSCQAWVDLDNDKISGWARPFKKYEFYEYEDGNPYTLQPEFIRENYQKAQTFTVGNVADNENFIAKSAKIFGYKVNSPSGQVIVSIRNVDYSGKPTGSDLCSGSIESSLFTNDMAGEWYNIGFEGTGCNLSANTQYALVVRYPDGDFSNYINWIFVQGSFFGPDYFGGKRYTTTGSWWVQGTEYTDFRFQVFGIPADGSGPWIRLDNAGYGPVVNLLINPAELENWSLAQGEIPMRWISYNQTNCDIDDDGLSDSSHSGCPFVGEPVPEHKVLIEYQHGGPPEAAIQCEDCQGNTTSSCSAYQREPNSLCLINKSTDPDGQDDIVRSIWSTKLYSDPDETYMTQKECIVDPILCDFSVPVPNFYPGNWYTAKLVVEDSLGMTGEATYPFYILRDISADFECSLNGTNFGECEFLTPDVGDTIYLQDITQLSEGAVSTDFREWDWEGTVFGGGVKNPSLPVDLPRMDITLVVRDNNNRIDSITHSILGYIPLPIWQEINPF